MISCVLFYIVANIYIIPKLHTWSIKKIITPLLLLNCLRHLWLMFIAWGVVLPWMPIEFSYPASWWDFLSAILAFIALYCIYYKEKYSKLSVQIFNIIWFLDFIMAITLSVLYKAWLFMWWSYRIPSFWVPMLLVSHYIIFLYLSKYWKQ